MIRVSVLYPNHAGSSFDMDYYCDHHLALVRERLGSALRGMVVDQGLSGAEPGTRPSFLAMAHLQFDSSEAFQQVFGPHAEEIIGDIPNFTNVEPVIQIGEERL